MNILNENFQRDHGVLKIVGDAPNANLAYENGNLTVEKTAPGWGTAGCTMWSALPNMQPLDSFLFNFTPMSNRVGTPADPAATFYKIHLAVDRQDEEMTQDGYGIYVEGGTIKLYDPAHIIAEFGAPQLNRMHRVVISVRSDSDLDVYMHGPGLPGYLGKIPGPFLNRRGSLVVNMFSVDTLKFHDFKVQVAA